jgi:hypothetical protein
MHIRKDDKIHFLLLYAIHKNKINGFALMHSIYKGKGSLDNGYFDNFDNEFLYKYKKNKNRKKIMDMLLYF